MRASEQGAAGAEPAERSETTGGREKRSRDRYGRDRSPRSELVDRPEAAARDESAAPEDATAEPRKSYFTANTEAAAKALPAITISAPERTAAELPTSPLNVTPTPLPVSIVAPAVAPVVAKTPLASPAAMPKLQPFELPLNELAEVAQSSGLSWVNSNAEKIATVQAAIAAEPKPIRVPRERPATVQLPTSPLVLVETKRDLRNITLPFEEQTPQ